ncbi:hypothetical protein PGTUg99_008389 [Puccinia graminis f. sp. tritici]|uniref:Uncharacterized protein n=1 Tax=Puccinia graminis f. sp. tritici TaxID=56615 RepID=A0A5B0S4Q7_PUCGR|nr:hypothetical protein PGTUg99_008389 [Puccinia graminis f. sp. tritici]
MYSDHLTFSTPTVPLGPPGALLGPPGGRIPVFFTSRKDPCFFYVDRYRALGTRPGPSDPTWNGRRRSQPVPTTPTPFQRPRVVRRQPDYPWIAVEGSELDLDRPTSLGTVPTASGCPVQAPGQDPPIPHGTVGDDPQLLQRPSDLVWNSRRRPQRFFNAIVIGSLELGQDPRIPLGTVGDNPSPFLQTLHLSNGLGSSENDPITLGLPLRARN